MRKNKIYIIVAKFFFLKQRFTFGIYINSTKDSYLPLSSFAFFGCNSKIYHLAHFGQFDALCVSFEFPSPEVRYVK